MKRFRFPLRPVSKLRAHYELRAREAFAAAVGENVRAEEKLAMACARVVQLEAAVVAGRQQTFSAAREAENLGAYRSELGAQVAAERSRAAAHLAMEQKRSEYIEAHRRLEVMERLEEKAHAAHRLEVSREEQAEFDDLSSRRAAVKTISAL